LVVAIDLRKPVRECDLVDGRGLPLVVPIGLGQAGSGTRRPAYPEGVGEPILTAIADKEA
jgi:hypothetical protein